MPPLAGALGSGAASGAGLLQSGGANADLRGAVATSGAAPPPHADTGRVGVLSEEAGSGGGSAGGDGELGRLRSGRRFRRGSSGGDHRLPPPPRESASKLTQLALELAHGDSNLATRLLREAHLLLAPSMPLSPQAWPSSPALAATQMPPPLTL